MRETQRNIKQYNQRLVYLKSKLATALLLFIMSIAMLTTATFAYVVLSTAPEIQNITTTVAGNGNLEIALASSDENGDPLAPKKSQVGDSELPLVERNITWGNLINLNDDSYGLQDIVLRPASLNLSNLKNKPLRAVKYGSDGRVTELDANYLYTNYNKENHRFMITEHANYGVRAISNVAYDNLSAEGAVGKFLETEKLLSNTQNYYLNLVDSKSKYMIAIADLMGEFGTAKANNVSDDALDVTKYLPDFYDLMKEIGNVYDQTLNVYWSLANAQLTNAGKPLISSLEELKALNEATFKGSQYSIMMDGFDKTIKDMNTLNSHIIDLEDEYLRAKNGDGKVYYSEIYKAVDFLVTINTATVATVNNPNDQYTISRLASDTSTALGMVGKDLIGTINDGAIWRLEQLIGAKMYAENMKISMKVTKLGITVPVSFDTLIISSVKAETYIMPALIERAGAADSTAALTAVAGDVYGMVLDFWIRTNADNAYLTLEGEKVTEQQPKLHNGYYIYEFSYVIEGDEGSETKIEQYFHIPDGTITETPETADFSKGSFYSVESGDEVVFSDETITRDDFVSSLTPVYQTVVVGYDGVNRVWEEGVPNPDRSTTQGAGSCYIIYPETPIVQQQALELLKSMGIAFIDEDGNMLAQADFKTDIAIEEEGKVIIPIELKNTSEYITDEYGETVYTITSLRKSEEKLISAIVYLDGTKLENADVSAENSINGTLNIQFGSSISLDSMDDSDLRREEITLSASLSATTRPYNSTTPIKLSVNVGGAEPDEIEAIFMRKINETQGVRQEAIKLTEGENGEWSTNVPFATPGVYVLRSVWIDGSEYLLSEKLELTIEGFEIQNVNLQVDGSVVGSYKHIMTTETSKTIGISLDVFADTYDIKNVQVVFGNEEGQFINASLNKGDNNSTWSGNATFGISGTYSLQFIVVNGDYHDVPDGGEKTLSLLLGVQAKVQVTPKSFEYDPKETDGREISVTTFIMNDKGDTLGNLTGVVLQYSKNGSNINPRVAELKWDSTRAAYVGKFIVKDPGIYSFSSLVIGKGESINTISKADAQTVSVINPVPPVFEYAQYKESYIDEYQFTPNKVASFSLPFSNAEAAQIKATFTHDGIPYTSDIGTIVNNENGIQTFKFTLPTSDANGLPISDMTGEWNLVGLSLTNVFIDNVLYAPDNIEESEQWVYWDVSSKNIETYVVEKMNLSIINGDKESIEFKEDYFTTYLAQNTYVLKDYEVSISDSDGNKESIAQLINDNELSISTPLLTYEFNKDSNMTWWQEYDSTVSNTSSEDVSPQVTFTSNGNLIYSNANNAEFMYPGTYVPKLSINIYNGNSSIAYEYEITKTGVRSTTNSPIIFNLSDPMMSDRTVSWKRPDVIFANVSNKDISFATYSGSGTVNKNNTNGRNTISSDGKTVKVYSHLSSYTTTKGWFGSTTEEFVYTNPTVYMSLVNVPSYSTISLTINNINHRSPGTLQGSAFKSNINVTFTGGNETSAILGKSSRYSTSRTLASSARPNIECVGDGSYVDQFVIKLSSGKSYTFTLNGNLVIDYDY